MAFAVLSSQWPAHRYAFGDIPFRPGIYMKFLHVYTISNENGKRRDDRELAKPHDLEKQINHFSYWSK